MRTLWDYNKDVHIDILAKLGNTYTHPYISENIIKQFCSNKQYNKILEPSVGSGSFYYNIKNILDFNSIYISDIDKDALDLIEMDNKTTKVQEDFLLSNNKNKYDLIITNPPYISYNNISSEKYQDKNEYIREIKNTIDWCDLGIHPDEVLKRSDIYIYFFLKSLSMLESTGELIFLCSDSWLNVGFGEVLKKVLQNKFKLESITSSHFYPFFSDETSAIITKISRRTNANENTICINHIKEPLFKISDTFIYKEKDFLEIINNDINTTNQINMYTKNLGFMRKIKGAVYLSDILKTDNKGYNYNTLAKENKILSVKTKETVPLFYQKQARVNAPANYKSHFNDKDIKYYVHKDDALSKYVSINSAFMIAVINKFPLIFTYKGKSVNTSKYYRLSFHNNDDIELIPMLLNNIITLLDMELKFKTANKRSATKNKNGSIKETSLKVLNNIKVPDFRLLSKEQKDNLLKEYSKYKNTQIFTIESALENEYYMNVQKMLFEYFDFGVTIKDVIKNVREMFAIRDRDLEYLGLELEYQ